MHSSYHHSFHLLCACVCVWEHVHTHTHTCVCGCRAEREVSCVLQSFYLCVCVFIKCSCRRLQRPEEGVGSPEVVAAGGCVLPEEDLGNQTLVLHRNDRYSSHWIHLHLSTLCFETRSVTPISDSPDWLANKPSGYSHLCLFRFGVRFGWYWTQLLKRLQRIWTQGLMLAQQAS